jgi:hypothetical protein
MLQQKGKLQGGGVYDRFAMDLAWVQRIGCRFVWRSVGDRGPAVALTRAVIKRAGRRVRPLR